MYYSNIYKLKIMVDAISKVTITGLGNGVAKWATEDTLQEIQTEMVRLVSIMTQKQKLKGVNVKGRQKEEDEHTKKLKALNKEQTDFTKKLKEQKQAFNDAVENTTDSLERIRAATKSNFNSMTALSNVGEGLAGIFKSLDTPAGILGSTLGVAGFAISKFIGYLTETSRAMIGLYDNGQTFSGGLGELRLAASKAVMPLEQFSQLVAQNGGLMKALGEKGVLSFGALAGQTQRLVKEQGGYAMSLSDVTNYTADNLEMLRKQGQLGRMTDAERVSSSAEYIRELTAFSQILGKSREQINKEIQEAKKTPGVEFLLSTMSKYANELYNSAIGQISGAFGDASHDVTAAFNELMKGPLGAVTPFSKALRYVAPNLFLQFERLAKGVKEGTLSKEQEAQAAKEFQDGLMNLSDAQKQALEKQIAFNGAYAEGSTTLEKAFSALQGANTAANAAAKAPDSITKSIVALGNTIEMIKAKFSELFATFIEKHQHFLEDIVNNLSKAADWILNTIENLMDPQTRQQAIDGMISGVKSVLDTLLDYIMTYIQTKLGIGQTGGGKILGTQYNGLTDYTEKRSGLGMTYDALKVGGAELGGSLLSTPGAIGTASMEGFREIGDWWSGGKQPSYAKPAGVAATPVVSPKSNVSPQSTPTSAADLLGKTVEVQTIGNDIASASMRSLQNVEKYLSDIARNTKNNSNTVQ